MKTRALMIFALAALAACSHLSTSIRTDQVAESVQLVTDRHDAYVWQDAELQQRERDLYLLEADSLRQAMGEETISREDFGAKALGVVDRHDRYVNADETLSALEQRVYLGSSSALRDLAPDPGK